MRRRHCVGGAPVKFGRRQSKKVGGAALAAKKYFSNVSDKISFYPQNFLMTFFSHRPKIGNKKVHSKKMVSRQISGGGANKLSATRPGL